jgi:hypothetical protein
MMQAPTLHATNAKPAAYLVVPGTRPSCADHPRAGADGIGGCAIEPGCGRVDGYPIQRIGQDRRDETDQRGRAVACA